jgi:hypothetical protein
MMGRGARFDSDETGWQLLKEREHVATLKLAAKDNSSIRIDAMNLKHRLRDIETDCRNRLHSLAPPNHECPNSTHIDGARRAGGGAVHSIKSCRRHRFQCIPDGYSLADKSLEGGDATARVNAPYFVKDRWMHQLPFEHWVSIAPKEWREREVDYDGPDKDGFEVYIMLRKEDFDYWREHLKLAPHAKSAGASRKTVKGGWAKKAISALWPGGAPPPTELSNKNLIRQADEWIIAECKRQNVPPPEISPDTILRYAGRKKSQR